MFFVAFGHAVLFAAGHELIRQGRRSLVVAPPVDPDLEPLTALLEKGFE